MKKTGASGTDSTPIVPSLGRVKCLCHCVTGCKDSLTAFSLTSWEKVRNAARIRDDHIHAKYKELLATDNFQGTYHRSCYQRYTNAEHLKRYEQRWSSPRKKKSTSQDQQVEEQLPSKRGRRSLSAEGLKEKEKTCFVCRKNKYPRGSHNPEKLLQCETTDVEKKIKEAIEARDDERNRLDTHGKDLIAIELSYHRSCYMSYTSTKVVERLQRLKQSKASTSSSSEKETDSYAKCFEVLSEEIKHDIINRNLVKSMSSLRDQYISLLETEGVQAQDYATRYLKRRITNHFGTSVNFVQPHPTQSEYIYNGALDVKYVLERLIKHTETAAAEDDVLDVSDVQDIAEVEKTDVYHCGLLLHNTIKEIEQTIPWPPSPEDICEEKINIPEPLYNLLAYAIIGTSKPVPDGKVPVNSDVERQINSLGQDLIHVVRKGHIRTVKNIGLGVAIRNITGSKEAANLLNRYGHCYSYSKIQDYEKALVKKLHGENSNSLTIPMTIQSGAFCTFVWDNNDLCEETLTGHGTTHVTNGIIIQREGQLPRAELQPDQIDDVDVLENVVLPFHLNQRVGPQPLQGTIQTMLSAPQEDFKSHQLSDLVWILLRQQPTEDLFTTDKRALQVIGGWSAFNADIADPSPPKSTIGFLQPVNESPTELPAMFTVLKRSQYFAKKLNIPEVDIVFDQATYAKACEIKWSNPQEFKNVLFRMGPFHAIPVLISVIFKRYGDAGLTDIITESELVAKGSLTGVTTGHHYNRSVRVIKVVYEAMVRLENQQFGEWLATLPDADIDLDLIKEKVLDFREEFNAKDCRDFIESNTVARLLELRTEFRKLDRGPMCSFWTGFLEMGELMLGFIRSCREGDLKLNLACFTIMVYWFFNQDQTNYSRSGAFHLCTMRVLQQTFPLIYEKLTSGHFGVQLSKSSRFAKIPEDQSIEETINKSSKIPGGIVGKSRNPAAVSQWIDTTADRSQITENVRKMAGLVSEGGEGHKEGGASRVRKDEQAVRDVIDVINNMRNPFLPSDELVSISTGVQATEETKKDLLSGYKEGKQRAETFIKDRILSNKVPFFDPITKLKLNTFTTQITEKKVKVGDKELTIRADRSFFCKLVFIAQSRNLDLFEVYSHELGPIPWAIATPLGTALKPDKAKLMEILEKDTPALSKPQGAAWIIDTFAAIQTLKAVPVEGSSASIKPQNFSGVAESILRSMCEVSLPQPARIDIVVDTYAKVSIKHPERERRSHGKGVRVQISSGTQRAPNDWSSYMKDENNKRELPEFLFSEWSANKDKRYSKVIKNTDLLLCHGEQCHKLKVDADTETIHSEEIVTLKCLAEEADTRLLLHAKQAADSGYYASIVIRSPDTDVFILALYFQSEMDVPIIMHRKASQKKWKFVNISGICAKLDDHIIRALPGFHAFSGSDSTSAFSGKAKKSFFNVLEGNAEFCEAMIQLGDSDKVSEDLFASCEAGLCHVYGHPRCREINQVRYDMLSKGNESHQIPPTQDALRLHIMRANYQALIWKHALDGNYKPPLPDGHGWSVKNDIIEVVWMLQDPAPQSLLEFVHCKSCKKCDTRRCTCKKNGMKCTDVCGCDPAACENSEDSGRFIPGDDEEEQEEEDED